MPGPGKRLEVKAMRLDEFVTELARYRSGWIRIDPAVARYRITGVFNTADTDQALRALTNSFPLKITYRSRYWVTISAADAGAVMIMKVAKIYLLPISSKTSTETHPTSRPDSPGFRPSPE